MIGREQRKAIRKVFTAVAGIDLPRSCFAHGQMGIINSEMVNYFPEPYWVG